MPNTRDVISSAGGGTDTLMQNIAATTTHTGVVKVARLPAVLSTTDDVAFALYATVENLQNVPLVL
ncbi:Uu.00g063910.m01.CDS01 [Anthostomella pinea]|uniref:Uu.00g063910.m01.CDS01 n=1 Tax=Anthostomella pinea TaxID=933095 RepID=A0AAI8VMW3_9PEZI|nr:Uu.00g063910.m01.CDS01 [Anthostomella pinea]